MSFYHPHLKKKKFQLSLVTYEKKKENPFKSKCFITACAMVCSVLLRWHDDCPFNGPPKANHIRQFCYSYDYKSNRTVCAMPQ